MVADLQLQPQLDLMLLKQCLWNVFPRTSEAFESVSTEEVSGESLHPLRQLWLAAQNDKKNPLEHVVEDRGTWKGDWRLAVTNAIRVASYDCNWKCLAARSSRSSCSTDSTKGVQVEGHSRSSPPSFS